MDASHHSQSISDHADEETNLSPKPFNIEAGDLNNDLENLIKSDAIGNTLYSKSWLLKFFLDLATTRDIKRLEASFSTETHSKENTDEENGTFDPENILSDFDSLVAMSAESTVAEYLCNVDHGCLGMLIAEILPIQINDEHKYFKEIRSHFWRRQELCLVVLSNIVIHKDVLHTMVADISRKKALSSNDDTNVLSELVRLSFSCVLFGENFGTEAEFTSVLVACFQFLRNLTYSLNLLICENQEELSIASDDSEQNTQMIAEKVYSKLPSQNSTSNVSRNTQEETTLEGPTIAPNSLNEKEQKQDRNNISHILVDIANEILLIVSKPEVVQHFGMMLASSCNGDLLNKMSRLLTVLLELSSDLEFENLISSCSDHRFLNCLKEALKQTFVESRDIKTTFVFIDFIGEVLNQVLNNEEDEKSKDLFRDTNGQKDEQFTIELLDIVSDVSREANDLPHCAMIIKICRILWNPTFSSKHTRSFQTIGQWLMNAKEHISTFNDLDMDDQVAYSSIIEGLDDFIKKYHILNESNDEKQNEVMLITKFVKSELSLLSKNQRDLS